MGAKITLAYRTKNKGYKCSAIWFDNMFIDMLIEMIIYMIF